LRQSRSPVFFGVEAVEVFAYDLVSGIAFDPLCMFQRAEPTMVQA
jgi:hypothetical protein